MLKHSSAFAPSFQCSFFHLCKVCVHLFHCLLRETSEKANISSISTCCGDWIALKNFSPSWFRGRLLMFEVDRSWQILLITIKLKTFVAPTWAAHCPGCLNRLWRSAGSLGLQSWWRARRNHTITAIRVTSLKPSGKQQTWPKLMNLYIGLRGDMPTVKGAVVSLLSFLDPNAWLEEISYFHGSFPPFWGQQLWGFPVGHYSSSTLPVLGQLKTLSSAAKCELE